MKKRHLSAALASLALVTGVVLAAPAGAATIVVDGVLDGTGPTMPVVFITPPNCTGQGTEPVEYRTYEIMGPVVGPNTITLTRGEGFASMYLYEGSFDPTDGMANCVAGQNAFSDGVGTIEYEFLPDTAYIIVVFDDAGVEGATYQLEYEDDGLVPPPPPPPLPPVVEEPGPSASGGAAPVTAAPRFTG